MIGILRANNPIKKLLFKEIYLEYNPIPSSAEEGILLG
jgi:hypothetical protein